MGRDDLTVRSGRAELAVWCFRPAHDEPAPAIVIAHGFGMTRDCRLDEVGVRFAAAGYLALVFDHPGFGDSGGTPRQVVDSARQRRAYRDVVAAARELPGCDGRVVVWGTSFSGGHALAVGAQEPELAAVIAQVPFADGRAMLDRDQRQAGDRRDAPAAAPDAGQRDRRRAFARHLAVLMLRALVDAVRGRVGLRPLLVPIVGPVGSGAVIAGDDTEPALRALVPDTARWRNEVAPRVVLQLPRDRPGRDAARITAPLLVCVVTHDPVTPPGPARTAAAAAPRGELRTYGFDHLDAYGGPHRDQLLDDQIAFLARHVPVAPPIP